MPSNNPPIPYGVSEFLDLICVNGYGVATIRRILKFIGLFCRIQSLLQGSFARETYHFKEPNNRSQPISRSMRPSLEGCIDLCISWDTAYGKGMRIVEAAQV